MKNRWLLTHKGHERQSSAQRKGYAKQLKDTVGHSEMRGSLIMQGYTLFWSVDEVIDGHGITLIEHKSINPPVPDWYFQSSLIQVALYHQLTLMVDHLQTASFKLKEGAEFEKIRVRGPIKSILKIGGCQFNVQSDERVLVFYLGKCRSLFSWDTAKEWDANYNRKEWKFLKAGITFGQKPNKERRK